MRAQVRYTYQDDLTIPEDTSRRHEIVDGELCVTAAPRFRHKQVVANLLEALRGLARQEGLGEVVTGAVIVHLHDEGVVEVRDVLAWRVGGHRFEIPVEELLRSRRPMAADARAAS